ncbi:hypothetical protein Cme02nite_53460 [Catellatospora methionotrophica]|uniref:Uncharacterized protein n=1 Tax=Catellatospora methionotrophica TaxID=121620 RepID=A0A8J3PHT2_9ACTN|nr:hypothetical protein Cme02nite_53460 [Catellatospora methionotrophica]
MKTIRSQLLPERPLKSYIDGWLTEARGSPANPRPLRRLRTFDLGESHKLSVTESLRNAADCPMATGSTSSQNRAGGPYHVDTDRPPGAALIALSENASTCGPATRRR